VLELGEKQEPASREKKGFFIHKMKTQGELEKTVERT